MGKMLPCRHYLNFLGLLLICWLPAITITAAPAKTTFEGTTYVSLDTVASNFGMEPSWIRIRESLRLHSKWTDMRFTEHKRDFSLNGTSVALGNPVLARNGTLYISETDYQKTVQAILTPHVFTGARPVSRIVIDPGHGGKDPGAQNSQLKLSEKNLALDLARRLKTILESRGYVVILTRNTDTFIPLADRAAFANRHRADLFISLHYNSATSSSVSGLETFAFTPLNQPSSGRASLHSSDRRTSPANRSDTWNILAAYHIQKQLVEELKGSDRGVKRARFTVLQGLEMPGVLVEGGFLSHPTESRNIGWSQYRQRTAQAIADGVVNYHKSINRNR